MSWMAPGWRKLGWPLPSTQQWVLPAQQDKQEEALSFLVPWRGWVSGGCASGHAGALPWLSRGRLPFLLRLYQEPGSVRTQRAGSAGDKSGAALAQSSLHQLGWIFVYPCIKESSAREGLFPLSVRPSRALPGGHSDG